MRRLLAWLLLPTALALCALALWHRPDLTPAATGNTPRTDVSQAQEKRADHAFVPWTPEPSAHAGEPVTIDLMDPPADRYAVATFTDADKTYVDLIAGLNRPDVIYDAALGRAARELAYQQSLLGGLIPTDIIDFLLKASGAVDRTVEQGYTATSGDGAAAARERLDAMLGPKADEPVHVGVGEVWIPGAKLPRIVALLVSRSRLDVSPAPRRVDLGGEWTLSGVLPPGFEAPSALILWPNGKLESLAVSVESRRFRVTVPVGATPGTLEVSVGATGPRGPITLVQLPVEVGRALPETFATRLPPDERDLTGAAAAEALAFDLLNADRARFGLKPLLHDRRLDEIAREHSADMRDHDFFGHRSPTTGDPGDRLSAARYRALAYAENLALESSLHAAETGLFASLGHRRNILNPDVTHVGIGLASRERGGHIEWHLTQLFALPVLAIDGNAEAERLRATIAARRRAAGLPELPRDPALDQVARQSARDAAAGKLDGIAEQARVEAQRAGLPPGRAHVWAQRTTEVATAELPREVEDASCTRIGIGVAQAADDPVGTTGIVVIFDGEPR